MNTQKKFVIIGLIFIGVTLSAYVYYDRFSFTVVCGSAIDSSCYRYRCPSGELIENIGGNVSCSDGSQVIRGGESSKNSILDK